MVGRCIREIVDYVQTNKRNERSSRRIAWWIRFRKTRQGLVSRPRTSSSEQCQRFSAKHEVYETQILLFMDNRVQNSRLEVAIMAIMNHF